MFNRKIFYLLVFILLMFSYNAFASSTADTYGLSAEGVARGNAMCANVNDWSSVWYNIAGLGKTEHLRYKGSVRREAVKMSLKKRLQLKKDDRDTTGTEKFYPNQIAFELMYSLPMLYINDPAENHLTVGGEDVTGDEAHILRTGAMVIGAAIDFRTFTNAIPDIISSARLGLALASGLDGAAMKINDIDSRTHNFMRYGREVQKATIVLGLGFGFMRDLFGFGIGVNVHFDGKGLVAIDNLDMSPTTQDELQEQTKMDLKISPKIVAGIYFTPGKLLKPIEGLEIGFSYRQEAYTQIYPFTTEAGLSIAGVDMYMGLGIFDYYAPHTFVGGLAFTKWDITFSVDLEFQMWSQLKVSPTDTKENIPTLQNILVLKCGLKAGIPDLEWLGAMVGYEYMPSFLPDESTSGLSNYLENNKHIFSLGAIFTPEKFDIMTGPVEFTITYQLQLLEKRMVNKDAVSVNNPNYVYGGTVHTLFAGVTLKL